MRRLVVATVAVALMLPQVACTAADKKVTELKTESAKQSYMLGQDVGAYLKQLDAGVDLDAFMQAIKDTLGGTKSLLTPEQTAQIKQEFSAKMQEKQAAKAKVSSEKNDKEGAAFLEKNKTEKGVVTTASGLQYQVLTEGTGPIPTAMDKVSVHYRGTLLDGTEFDSSIKRGQPASFSVTGVIPGWTEALQLMKVGSKYKLFIPSKLAYAERGAGPQIGPGATLIFEVELLSIDKPEPAAIAPATAPAAAPAAKATKPAAKPAK